MSINLPPLSPSRLPTPRCLTIRIRYRTLAITALLACLLVLLAGAIFFLHALIGSSTETKAEAISPDGLYRVVVQERNWTAQSKSLIYFYRRKDYLASTPHWDLTETKEVYNDSSMRANYSIVWTLDKTNASTSAVVYGDFGTPPFKGEILWTRKLP